MNSGSCKVSISSWMYDLSIYMMWMYFRFDLDVKFLLKRRV